MVSDLDINSDDDFESDYESDICDRDDEQAITTSSSALQSTHQPTISANSIDQIKNRSSILTPTNISVSNSNTSAAPISESTVLDQTNSPNISTININENQSEQIGDASVSSNTHSNALGGDFESSDPVISSDQTSREEMNSNTNEEDEEDEEDEEAEEDEEQEVHEEHEEQDGSQVVFLTNGMIYVDGFVVHEDKVIDPYSMNFWRLYETTFREIANRHLRLVRVSDYVDSRVIRVHNETLFQYVQQNTVYARYVGDTLSFSEYNSHNAVKLTGVKVYITTGICALIVFGPVEPQVFRFPDEEENQVLLRE
ncbi:uncharacterized protein KGF55_000100 [Candida pseudojiufengensis]|uniref:uncharacterized protein n=1 Tax=Candida pseudojiufengensis TaxID=497109 RepID=UPI0022248BAB|nr:uncharacterized protein KGF55_000100 [Candida pseudojiufengensis]KAI5967460.1 hypothetical protein KGF55_000100 [Candida pseudojiufengensis]